VWCAGRRNGALQFEIGLAASKFSKTVMGVIDSVYAEKMGDDG